jgi:hypothetical protein
MGQDSEAVACRVHPDVKRWLEEQAEDRGTTLGSYVEELLRSFYQGETMVPNKDGSMPNDPEPDPGNSLPEGVYVPDSGKYDYAVRWRDDAGEAHRRYYKTRKGAIQGAKRLRG